MEIDYKKLKADWIEALESGKFRQGHGELKYTDSETGQCHCCLGVLGVVAGMTIEGNAVIDGAGVMQGYTPIYNLLIEMFPALAHMNPDVCGFFWRMNDCDRLSFKEIAEVIKKTE
jgi:hypothetical protein